MSRRDPFKLYREHRALKQSSSVSTTSSREEGATGDHTVHHTAEQTQPSAQPQTSYWSKEELERFRQLTLAANPHIQLPSPIQQPQIQAAGQFPALSSGDSSMASANPPKTPWQFIKEQAAAQLGIVQQQILAYPPFADCNAEQKAMIKQLREAEHAFQAQISDIQNMPDDPPVAAAAAVQAAQPAGPQALLNRTLTDEERRRNINLFVEIPEDNDGTRVNMNFGNIVKVLRPHNDKIESFRSFFVTLFAYGQLHFFDHAAYKTALQYVLQGSQLTEYLEIRDSSLSDIVQYFTVKYDTPELPQLALRQLDNFRRHPGEHIMQAMERCKLLIKKSKILLAPEIRENPDTLLTQKLLENIGPKTKHKVNKEKFRLSQLGQFLSYKELLDLVFNTEIVKEEFGPPDIHKAIPALSALSLNETPKINVNTANMVYDKSVKGQKFDNFRERRRSLSRENSRRSRERSVDRNRPGLQDMQQQAHQDITYQDRRQRAADSMSFDFRQQSDHRPPSRQSRWDSHRPTSRHNSRDRPRSGSRPKSPSVSFHDQQRGHRPPSNPPILKTRDQTPGHQRSGSQTRPRSPYGHRSGSGGGYPSGKSPGRGGSTYYGDNRPNLPINPNAEPGKHIPMGYRKRHGDQCVKCRWPNAHYTDECDAYIRYNPYPCTICAQARITSYHYESECLNNPNRPPNSR